jgi:hypothetical protein
LGCNRFAALMQNCDPTRSPCELDADVANLYLLGKYGCTINKTGNAMGYVGRRGDNPMTTNLRQPDRIERSMKHTD